MYDKSMIGGPVAFLMKINPLVAYVDLFRSPLAHAVLPSASSLSLAVIYAVASLMIGLLVFSVNEKKIVYRL